MQQTLLRINTPPGTRLFPTELRTMVAALDIKSPALFARDADGKTQNHPGVRFVGGPRWIGAVADQEHTDVLMSNLGHILLEVNKFVGQPCPFNVESREFDIARAHYPIKYCVFGMALKARSDTRRGKSPLQLLTDSIYSSIERTSLHYGLDCPERDELGLMDVEIERHHGMMLKTTYTDKGEYMDRFNLTFSLHAELKGIWQLGSIQARGHGLVQRIRADGFSSKVQS